MHQRLLYNAIMVIGTFVLSVCLAGPAKAPAADFSVDVFLVANNPVAVSGLDWIDNGQPVGSVQKALRPILLSFNQSKTPFLIIDGGNCGAFARSSAVRTVTVSARSFSSVASMTQTVKKGKTSETEVLERTDKVSTTVFGMNPRPYTKLGGGSKGVVSFDESKVSGLYASFEDLNSFGNSGKDREGLDKTILLSSDPLDSTMNYLRAGGQGFDGVCICTWGLPQRKVPSVVSFPAEGDVSHFKLIRQGNRWRLSFVEYLESK